MNWAAFAFKSAQTDYKLGSDIMNITANYLTSLSTEASLKAKSRNMEMQIENLKDTAVWHEKQAGEEQKVGRAERESRLVKLGQDLGSIHASASGSGIDISSKVVGKTISDTVKSAYNDAYQIAINEQKSVQNEMNAAASYKLDAVFAEENKMWNDFEIELEKSNRKWAVVSGALSAAGNWAGGMAGAGSALFGG